MAIFNFNKKSKPVCSCGCASCSESKPASGASVKVLGGGCKNCHKLQENAQQALASLGMDTTVELVTDPAAMVTYGVMSTPALVVDGKVVSAGRVLTPEQAASYFSFGKKEK